MRSATGCWTCRLRRKKCDEQQPFCQTCKARDIVCYGYGPRPTWMDRGENERKASERLSRAMKMAAERRREGNKMPNKMEDILEVSFVPNEFYDEGLQSGIKLSSPNGSRITQKDCQNQKTCDTSSPSTSFTVEDCRNYQSHHSTPQDHYWQDNDVDILSDCRQRSLMPSMPSSTQEATLLMHYLDNIFPAQFRFYNPPQSLQGRGWLFLLLTQTKHVYHAALSLSAYYLSFNTSLDSVEGSLWRPEAVRHRVLALNYLQESIEGLNKRGDSTKVEGAVEALAGIALLICFEWSRGGIGNWQLHFQAASTLLPILTSYLETLESPSEKSTTPVHLTTIVQVLVVVFLRFDALSCISTGKQPIFKDSYLPLLEGPNSKVQMQSLVGCKNWAFTLIIETAILDEWKRKAQDRGKLSFKELMEKAAYIELRLRKEINHNSAFLEDLEQAAALSDEGTVRENHSYTCGQVTNIFAYANLLYLHVVVSGWNTELAEVQENVSRVILSFKSLPDKRMLGDLSWPFCIAGCVARREYEGFFRSLVAQVGFDLLRVGNLRNAFQLMETCWSKRDELVALRKGSEWQDVMAMLGPGLVLA